MSEIAVLIEIVLWSPKDTPVLVHVRDQNLNKGRERTKLRKASLGKGKALHSITDIRSNANHGAGWALDSQPDAMFRQSRRRNLHYRAGWLENCSTQR